MKNLPEDGSLPPVQTDGIKNGRPNPPKIDFSKLSPYTAEKLREELEGATVNRDPYGMDSEELSDMNRMLREFVSGST